MEKASWESGVTLILGVWLFVSPFFGLGDATAAATWNSWLIGGLVAVVSLFGLSRPRVWEEFVNLAAGIWIFFAPYLYNYSGVADAAWNHLLVGGAIAAIAAYGLLQRRAFNRTTPA
ncbi:SPW repeat protein [Persicimonas caeni]|nr:SPW repeat protein [Persicimonas caeni]